MRNFNITPATREEIQALTGEAPTMTVRAFMVKEDETPLAVMGFFNYQTHLAMFSYIKPEVQQHLKDYRRGVIKAYRYLMDIAKEKRLPVFSKADPDIEGSDRLLTHIGFKSYREGVYEWRG